MSISDVLTDIMDAFNIIDRAEGWLAALTNVERGTHGKRLRKRGMTQMSIPVCIPSRDGHVTGAQAEAYLKRYGIPMHGKRITSKEIIFSVPSQQAAWARALLARMDTPQQPKAWRDQKRGSKPQ